MINLPDILVKYMRIFIQRAMKGLTTEIRIIPQKQIECLYTLLPAILKDERGYWRSYMDLSEYGDRIKVNLIKKWNQFEHEKIG